MDLSLHLGASTVVSIALLGILLFLLGANVTRHRAQRGGTGNQMPTDPADRMFIAIRAHGNATEYVPTLIVLLLVCDVLADGWWVAALAVAAFVSRLLHAVGMLTSATLASHGPLRDIGAMGTYVTGVALGVTAIVAGV
ncbi:MAPEG family protein [Oryzobacter telluris]|uniref:MAPEG family protein n=1 Tax=Oryzobacter telluris TaxID=3149179 RepID=UPI00370D1A40